MRYLGIDYGQKRVGLALGEQGLSRPLAVYQRDQNLLEKIYQLCLRESIDYLVLGFSQDLGEEIKEFAEKLKTKVNLPLDFQDETLTSQEAVDTMILSLAKQKDRRQKLDAVAAAQILAAYFNSQ